MINPAQYTQVLQQASDPQLMQMLKRPDKIPSQFVVAEINRRQSMRQAAMAERQRQAGVQEMMTAQQAMPQQQAMMPQEQRPVGMNIGGGGPNLFTALGMNTNAPGPERYGIPPFDPNRETVSEYNFRVNKARRDKMAMERMAIADAAMRTDADIQRPDNTAAGLRDAEMFMSTTGRSGDVEDLGSQASGVPSEASRRDGGVKDPFFKFGGVNLGNVFSDGSPADILKALQGTGATVSGPDERGLRADRKKRPPGEDTKGPFDTATSGGRNDPPRKDRVLEPNNEIIGARGDRSRRLSGEQTVEDQVLAQRAADEAALANREAYFSRPAVVTPENPNSVKKGGGITAFTEGDAGENLPVKTDKNTEEMNRTKTASEVAAQALEAFSVDITDANNSDKGIKTPGVATSIESQSNTSPADGGTTSGGITNTGGATTDRSIDTTRVDTGPDKSRTTQVSLAEQMVADNKGLYETLKGGYETLAAGDRERANSLKSELDTVTSAMEKMAEVYDKNAMKPENRIFRSMIDAGLALAGSKETNFLQAVAESGKVGLQTFDRLNTEEKDRLFKKYGAAVDLAKTRADITGKINTLMAGADRTAFEGQAKSIEGQIAGSTAVMEAAQRDTAAEQADRAGDQRDVGLSADVESKEVGMEQTDRGLDQKDSALDQGQQQIDLSRDRLLVDQDLGQQRIDVQRDGNDIQLFLGGKKLELTALTAAATNANAQERNAIDRFIAEKPAASVAYLDEVASRFGDDVAKQMILGKSSGGMDMDNSSITTTARTFAISDFDAQTPIPGQQPQGDDGTYTQSQYFDYHLRNIRTSIYGSAPGGSSQAAAGPADDTLDFGD